MQTYAVQHPEVIDFIDGERLWKMPRWFALYTRSRHEKLVDHELQKKGIKTFLPLRRVVRHWSDRKKTIEDPLFSGYLFVHTSLERRINVLNTQGAIRFIGNHSHLPTPVTERDLSALRRFVEEEISIDPFPYLKEGMRVYVRSGPFKGIEGFIIRKDDHSRLVVSIDLLMQSVSVEIDQSCVEIV